MNNFTANYNKILEVLQQIESKINFPNQKRKPLLSDIVEKTLQTDPLKIV